MPSRILLFGRDGQVGFELRRALNADAPGPAPAPGAAVTAPSRTEADFREPDMLAQLVRDTRPEIIINAAAYTAVDAAEKEESIAHRVNADAPAALAREAKRCGALLVHYSTDYVFDGSKRTPYREDDPVAPASAYGRTKLAGEQAIRDSGCRHLILRTSWVYAARGKNFVLTMLRLANERPELRVVADQVGSPTWARAIAEATVQLIDRDAIGTYHMTGSGQASWHEFALEIVARGAALGLCKKVPVHPITTAEYPTPARRPAYSVLSNDKIRKDFGWRMPDWKDSLQHCLEEE